ncbi:MAG: Nif3-like dinuclear metal center hexameric protein [Thermodesulfobacteriota bacterium]
MRAQHLLEHIEALARPDLAASWDQSGVQIAGTADRVSKLAVALDPTIETVEAALQWGAEWVLAHHPLSLKPCLPGRRDTYHAVLQAVLGSGAWLYAAHTSLDVQPAGPVAWLAQALGLHAPRLVVPSSTENAWLFTLSGLEDPSPLETLPGVIEITACGPAQWEVTAWPRARSALSRLPAQRIQAQELLRPKAEYGFGCQGELRQPLAPEEFTTRLRELLPITAWTESGPRPERVSSVAYCPGSGGDFAPAAFTNGADVFLTGDVKYHQAQDLERRGWVLDVGHFSLEEQMMAHWATRLEQELADHGVTVRFFPGRDPLQRVHGA